ncbi:hypothetical protein VRK_08450 [Vibrio sp. MEBiC08052]|nr:hypothetical protein VRK_08450 [Vibrio sp. MEBiC08052]
MFRAIVLLPAFDFFFAIVGRIIRIACGLGNPFVGIGAKYAQLIDKSAIVVIVR